MNTSAIDKRIKSVCDEGWIIYRDWLKRNESDSVFRELGYQPKYEYYMKMHMDFARQYPIIMRYLASFGMYSRKAVSQYLKKCNTTVVQTDEDYAERQADFVKYLYMDLRPHMDRRKLNMIWQQIKDEILSELKTRNAELKKIKDIREKSKDSNASMRLQNIKDRIMKISEATK